MHIGVLQFTIEIPYAASLKDKRSVVKSLKDRLRKSFNISIAETEDLDSWTMATLGITVAGTEVAHINSTLDRIVNQLADMREASLVDHSLEIFNPQ